MGAELLKCDRGAEVQGCSGAVCRGALRFRGAVAKGAPEVEWCRSAEVQVKRGRGVEVQRFRSSEVQGVQRCIYRVAGAEVQVLRGAEQVQS